LWSTCRLCLINLFCFLRFCIIFRLLSRSLDILWSLGSDLCWCLRGGTRDLWQRNRLWWGRDGSCWQFCWVSWGRVRKGESCQNGLVLLSRQIGGFRLRGLRNWVILDVLPLPMRSQDQFPWHYLPFIFAESILPKTVRDLPNPPNDPFPSDEN